MDLFARFIGLMVVFVIYIAVDVEGVAYDGACASDAECNTDTNADKCDIGVTDKCICNDDSFRQASSSTCIAKLALNAVCVTSDAGTCADTNSECKDDSGTDKCLCTTTHYDATNVCTLKKALNEVCTTTEQCADANAECPSSSCTCKSAFFANKNGACAAVVTTLEGDCDATDSAAGQCTFSDTSCTLDGSAGKCKCIAATHYSDTSVCQPRKAPEDDCSGDECVEHAACDTTCKCEAGYTASPSTNPTMCSGVVKFASLSYMYVVPILVSLMFLVR